MNPAPTDARTSRTLSVCPVGAPFNEASALIDRCVLAMQIGRSLTSRSASWGTRPATAGIEAARANPAGEAVQLRRWQGDLLAERGVGPGPAGPHDDGRDLRMLAADLHHPRVEPVTSRVVPCRFGLDGTMVDPQTRESVAIWA